MCSTQFCVPPSFVFHPVCVPPSLRSTQFCVPPSLCSTQCCVPPSFVFHPVWGWFNRKEPKAPHQKPWRTLSRKGSLSPRVLLCPPCETWQIRREPSRKAGTPQIYLEPNPGCAILFSCPMFPKLRLPCRGCICLGNQKESLP